MLEIFNSLEPFFNDCYAEYGVRDYAKLIAISPPTSSRLLHYYEKEGLLKKRIFKTQILFSANRENTLLKDFSRTYWKYKLTPLIQILNETYHNPTIILFGSLSKLETTPTSDIDIAIITPYKNELDLTPFGKKLKRTIQLFTFKKIENIPEDLRKNIINGYVIEGEL